MERMREERAMIRRKVNGEELDCYDLAPRPTNRDDWQQDSSDEVGDARSERRAAKERKPVRKRKRPRAQASPPQPKPMWPAYLLIGGAVLYFFSPWDLVPDFLLGPGQADDFGLFYVAYKKWRERSQHNATMQHFQSPMHQDWMPEDAWDGRRMAPHSRSNVNSYQPIDEEPGFFGRAMKAVSYLFSGGGL